MIINYHNDDDDKAGRRLTSLFVLPYSIILSFIIFQLIDSTSEAINKWKDRADRTELQVSSSFNVITMINFL